MYPRVQGTLPHLGPRPAVRAKRLDAPRGVRSAADLHCGPRLALTSTHTRSVSSRHPAVQPSALNRQRSIASAARDHPTFGGAIVRPSHHPNRRRRPRTVADKPLDKGSTVHLTEIELDYDDREAYHHNAGAL